MEIFWLYHKNEISSIISTSLYGFNCFTQCQQCRNEQKIKLCAELPLSLNSIYFQLVALYLSDTIVIIALVSSQLHWRICVRQLQTASKKINEFQCENNIIRRWNEKSSSRTTTSHKELNVDISSMHKMSKFSLTAVFFPSQMAIISSSRQKHTFFHISLTGNEKRKNSQTSSTNFSNHCDIDDDGDDDDREEEKIKAAKKITTTISISFSTFTSCARPVVNLYGEHSMLSRFSFHRKFV